MSLGAVDVWVHHPSGGLSALHAKHHAEGVVCMKCRADKQGNCRGMALFRAIYMKANQKTIKMNGTLVLSLQFWYLS